MCGIAGAIDLTGADRIFPRGQLRAMTDAIVHRGPDDEGAHLEPGLALGARRLSIVDLAGGHQPISNEDDSIWVAFNGELFEYPEIRRNLQSRGHILATRCDTEAWVHLFEDHGEGVFHRARGQFAVSLWDRRSRTLFLGRDRVGICPLYYAESDGWLIWGSEIKAILASGLVRATPDPKGLDYFFNFFSASPSRTVFEGIRLVPPGHYLKVRDGRVQVQQYWDLDFPDLGDERRLADPTALVDELEDHLATAIERRLRGDVPVASYLSGGLDSTVVLGLATRERGAPVASYTIGLDGAGPDERTQAAESALALGSPLTTVAMGRSAIASAYPDLIRAAEVPVVDTSCACLLRLAEAVHDRGHRVVLTGEGADEALAGYIWFKMQRSTNLFRAAVGDQWSTRVRNLALDAIGGGRTHRSSYTPIHGLRTAQQDLYDLLGQSRSLFYSDGMWNRLGDHSAYADTGISNNRIGRWAPLNQSLYVGYKMMLAGLLLGAKGDRVAMNASVEARYPFLDDDLIQFCAGIAPEYKLRGRTNKWLLRQVAGRTLPARIAGRPKTMFRASRLQTFFGVDRPAWVDQLLSPESLRATGYFDPNAIARARKVPTWMPILTPKRLGLDLSLTCVVSTQLWHHTFCGGGLCDLPTWSAPRVSHESADLTTDEPYLVG